MPTCQSAVRPTSDRNIGPVFSHNAEYRCTTKDLLFRLRFIHCTMISPFILRCFSFSLTDYWKGEKLQVVLIKRNGLYLLCHIRGQMHVNMIIGEPAVKIIKCNVNIAVYWLKSNTISHGDYMYVFLGCYMPIQLPIKLLPSACDVRLFSPCTDSSHKLWDLQHSSHKLWDLQHFMFEQIDLHIFKAVINDYSSFFV